jgi:hypothetical protein
MSSLTANQARDKMLESDFDAALVQLARECEADRRKDSETYLKCPRCYGHHSVHGNFDNLCDGCISTILTHFPNHACVPRIREFQQVL